MKKNYLTIEAKAAKGLGGIAAEPTVSAIVPSAASAIPLPQVVSAGILAADRDWGKPLLTR